MKRPLNKIEKKLTKEGLEKREKEIIDLTETLNIHNKQKEFIKAKIEYEDLIVPYNRKVDEQNLKTRMEKIEEDIKLAELDIINLKSQLSEGVEVKKMVGVA